ncbi:hypothetical protein [Microbacterium phage MO526]|uniref:Minor tail protein n=1 Tax=Microbacterium phage MO526 TaxID=3108092 RepID=A0ABZ0ZXI8_9CAUD|nr:hypothetical protein [Microbacterium phage MO526]
MSVYDGYLAFGGNEIVNNSRTRGLAESAAPCPMYWLKGPVCDTMNAALFEDAPYDYGAITEAPWYDPDEPQSADFFGFFAYSITEAMDSTRAVTRTESITDGGVLGRTRRATKTMRVRGLLMGRGRRAVEYGQAWLSSAVDPGACGQHGSECGLTDLQWFADCPPPRGQVYEYVEGEDEPVQRPQNDEEYAETIRGYVRYLHDVSAISGPLVLNTLESGDFLAYEVEMVFGAERPWVFGAQKDVELPPTVPVVIQDIPYNLVPAPSAELAAGDVVAARNLAPNPSVETNATDWYTNADGAPIVAANLSGARSTALAAVGAASYRSLFTAPSASATPGTFYVQQTVPIADPLERHSFNLWAALIPLAGVSAPDRIDATAYWQNAANTTLRADPLGVIDVAGGAVSVSGILPPPGATKVIVRATGRLASWSSGATVQLFADAVAVTVP